MIEQEFVKALKEGEVLVQGIGTFSVTEYKKTAHPSLVSNGSKKSYTLKARKITRINFKPHKGLKEQF